MKKGIPKRPKKNGIRVSEFVSQEGTKTNYYAIGQEYVEFDIPNGRLELWVDPDGDLDLRVFNTGRGTNHPTIRIEHADVNHCRIKVRLEPR